MGAAGGGGETRSGLWLRRARRAMAATPAAASGCGGRGGRRRRDPQRPLAAAGAAGDGGETRSGLWLRRARRAAAGTTWTTHGQQRRLPIPAATLCTGSTLALPGAVPLSRDHAR